MDRGACARGTAGSSESSADTQVGSFRNSLLLPDADAHGPAVEATLTVNRVRGWAVSGAQLVPVCVSPTKGRSFLKVGDVPARPSAPGALSPGQTSTEPTRTELREGRARGQARWGREASVKATEARRSSRG